MENKNGEKISHKIIKIFGLKILDFYIIRKFLGTFVFSILIIISIAVIFDLAEKLDDFIETKAPIREVILDYYFNFIPYFAVLFSYLFTFISVIFFTSKMAYNTEIIAILSSGVSLRRLMLPYLISATIIAIFSYLLSNYVIPHSNKVRLDFEEKYIHKQPLSYNRVNIHRQIEPGVFVYMNSYSTTSLMGYDFSLEKFENGKLVYKLMGARILFDTSTNKWSISNYYERKINGLFEKITEGDIKDTTLNMSPDDFNRRLNVVESMSLKDLKQFIRISRMQGETNLTAYQIEQYKRISFPFSTLILTLIGLTVSYRKVRGGIGVQLGAGLIISFSYILFMQFSAQFSIGGSLPPALAVWLPNIIFTFIGLIMYHYSSK